MRKLALLALLLWPACAQAQQPPAQLWCLNAGGGGQSTKPCPGNLATTNGSQLITTGLTYQLLFAASINRASITIENNNATDKCYLLFGLPAGQVTAGTTTTSTNVTTAGGKTLTAIQASIVLLPGGAYGRYFPYAPSDAIYITCDTTSDPIYADAQ